MFLEVHLGLFFEVEDFSVAEITVAKGLANDVQYLSSLQKVIEP